MSPSDTSILLVPGAWHTPDCFSPIVSLLEKAGYTVDLIPLASVDASPPLENWDPDVATIRKAINTAAGRGHKVVLLGHSYGGIPSSEAIKGLDSHITSLFLCCSFIIPQGKSLIAAFGGDLPWFKISEDRMVVNPATPADTFYNDLSPSQIDDCVSKLRPFSYQTMHSPVTYEAWRNVPTTYLYCLQDQAIPLQVQKMMVEQFAQGVGIKTETVDASHSPFISKPEETVNAIRRAAGERIEWVAQP